MIALMSGCGLFFAFVHVAVASLHQQACLLSSKQAHRICFVQRARPWHAHTPDLEESDAYAELVRLAVKKDPSLADLAAQHLQVSSKPRHGAAAEPPPAASTAKAPWLR
jgi:hypothetical protein